MDIEKLKVSTKLAIGLDEWLLELPYDVMPVTTILSLDWNIMVFGPFYKLRVKGWMTYINTLNL